MNRNIYRVTSPAWLLLVIAGLFSFSASSRASTVLIDFGGSGTTTDGVGRTWTRILTATDVSGSPHTLISSANTDSGYRLTVSNPPGVTNPVGFNGENTGGTSTPTGTAAARNYPSFATSDSLYGNMVTFNSNIVEGIRLTLTNLQPTETYTLYFYASRMGAGGDNREAEYHVTGGNVDTSVFLNASENTGNVVSVPNIAPNGSNQIIIDLDPGPNNNNSNRFYYLGAMEIVSTPVPEPGTWAMLALGGAGLGLVQWRRKSRSARA